MLGGPEMTDDTRRPVPLDEAIARLGSADYVHTFTNPRPDLLIGFEYPRAELIEAFRTHAVEEAGEAARAMGHPLVILKFHGRPLFVEASPRPDPAGAP